MLKQISKVPILKLEKNICLSKNLAVAIDNKPEGWDGVKPYESIPGPKPLPIFGNTWRFLIANSIHFADHMKLIQMMRDDYGDFVASRKQYPVPDIITIFDPKDIEMFVRNEGTYPWRINSESNSYYRGTMRKHIFGSASGLVTTQGKEWHAIRSKVNPILLQPSVAKKYIKPIDEVSSDFVCNIKKMIDEKQKGELRNFLLELNKWAFESIGVIALDTRLGVLDEGENEAAKLMVPYMVETFRMRAVLDFSPFGILCRKFNLPYWRKFVKYLDYFTNMTLKYMEEAEERIRNRKNINNSYPVDHEKSVLEKLLQVDTKIATAIMMDMLTGGIDTTGKLSAAALYFLAKNPEKQEILRKEVMAAMPNSDTPVTSEILEAIPYIRAVVKETGRLAPIAVGHARNTTKDLILRGHRIPKGVRVFIPTLYLSRQETYYPRPMEFIPERWLKSNIGELSQKNTNPFVTLPFGFGARSCVGVRFANLELEILIIKIVRNFLLEWKHADMTFGHDFLYGVKDPLNIHITQINK